MFLRMARFDLKEGEVENFAAATLDHVNSSRAEQGILRFELYRRESAPASYLLLMQFLDDASRERHFATEHFKSWKEQITPMLAAPIEGESFLPVGVG